MLLSILFIIIAFFWGGIPIGYLIVKAKTGQDIRTLGSKNIGATNVGRVLGKKWFFFVLLLDAVKGAIPAGVFYFFFPDHTLFLVLIGMFTILGNLFSPYLHFKGGKGIGTSIGVLVVLSPIPFLGALGVFLIVLLLFNFISLGSLFGILTYPILIAVFYYNIYILAFAILLFLLIVYKHRENIKRLWKGEENKFIKKR